MRRSLNPVEGQHIHSFSPRLCGGRGVGVRGDQSPENRRRYPDAPRPLSSTTRATLDAPNPPLTPTPLPPQSRGERVDKVRRSTELSDHPINSSPRATVTAVPPRNTRSPATRTAMIPPRGDA